MKCRCWRALLASVVLPLAFVGFLRADAPPSAGSASAPEMKIMTASQLAAFIDERIALKWEENKITPAPVADDAEFHRRISLDITGRIPHYGDARDFLSETAPDRRAKLIDKLIGGPQYVDHFTTTLRRLMIPKRSDIRANFYATNFERWLISRVRENVGYDKMVYELLTATTNNVRRPGQPYNAAAASTLAFYQANENKAENVAATTSRIFLGVRLECAQCHDHPFADWTRNQFWEYTAFFQRIQPRTVRAGQPIQQPARTTEVVNLPTMKIPGTKRSVNAKFLDGKIPYWDKPRNPQVVLADWITAPKNPYFARTASNRLWAHFFGVGLIEPVDELPTKEKPISHPVLLKELTRQFVAHKFDMQYLIRAITLSKTYQRTSTQTHPSQKEPQTFARMSLRGLTPEQLFESLARATGYRETGRTTGRQFFGVQNNARSKFLSDFASTDHPTETKTSILQALTLMNGTFIADATSIDKSMTFQATAKSPFATTRQKIETLYMAALSRPPRQAEIDRLLRYVKSGGPQNDPEAALADVFWALLNSSEFYLNH